MPIILLILLLTLIGCTGPTRPFQWEYAEIVCGPHKGIKEVNPSSATWNIKIRCNDGVDIITNLTPQEK